MKHGKIQEKRQTKQVEKQIGKIEKVAAAAPRRFIGTV